MTRDRSPADRSVTGTGPADRSAAGVFTTDRSGAGLSATGFRAAGFRAAVGLAPANAEAGPPRARYPLVALAALAAADGLAAGLLPILAPDISASLGVSRILLSLLAVGGGLLASLAGLGYAALTLRRLRRSTAVVIAAAVAALATVGVAWVDAPGGLVAAELLFLALGRGAVPALHRPLLADSCAPGHRVRTLSAWRAATVAGVAFLPAAVVGGAALFDLTWRAAFLAGGLLAAVALLVAARLRDPGAGHHEAAAVAGLTGAPDGAGRPGTATSGTATSGTPVPGPLGGGTLGGGTLGGGTPIPGTAIPGTLGGGATGSGVSAAATGPVADDDVPPFGEALRRTLAVPGFRLLLVLWAVVGMLSFPLVSFVAFLFDERFDTGPAGRLGLVAAGGAAAVLLLAAFGRRGDEILRGDPAAFVRLVAVGLTVVAAGLVATAASPAVAPAAVAAVATSAALALVLAALDVLTVTLVEPRLRVMASALAGVFLVGIGTVSGVLLLGGLDRRFGIRLAVVALALPALLGAALARRGAAGVAEDLDGLAEREVSRGRLRAGAARGERFPLLACGGIDFAYGQLQVLFDVTFTVDEGEMVALLGTNGAGKSTLLRVISGLGFPRRGSVAHRGSDITYLDAERRVALGITQISGGHAVFGPLDVVENLRVYGYTLGRSRRRVEEAIEAALDAFPRLAERRHNPAATLSGGEQQMLGLTKALMLQPRLLLIDELSLGLAPVVVGQLLGMVERINAAGTAVVLVEQSVNVALSLVSHAYFMEKGEIRFDGLAKDLLQRPDLLRSVFLEGAGRALS